MAPFGWSALPASLARDLAEELGLGGRNASHRIAELFPDGPSEEFVRLTWPVLRDRWISREPELRQQVVATLHARGLGDAGLLGPSAAAQRAYLASCRNSGSLRQIVLGVLLASFAPDGGRGRRQGGRAPTPAPSVQAEAPSPGPGVDAKVESAWAALEQRLAEAIDHGQDGDRVVLRLAPGADGGDGDNTYYVQWAVADGHAQLEAVSNAFLAPARRLTREPLARLAALGWQLPTPNGPANFHLDMSQDQASSASSTLVRTLREVYNAPHPAFLTVEGFNQEQALDLSVLGLPAPRHGAVAASGPAAAVDAGAPLRAQVVAVLAHGLGVSAEAVVSDEDGDFPLRSGSTMVFVRVLEDQGLVSLFSPVLVDVDDTDALRRALIDVQGQVPLIHFVVEGGVVTAAAQVIAGPLVPDHLHRVIALMIGVCDQLDDRLQGDFGGRTFFGDPAQTRPVPAPEIGGYL
ncbi:MAG TPA: hypothetical protein VIM19_05945 [Actinomycetes bacterium]